MCLLGELDATVAAIGEARRGGALLQPARRLSRRGDRGAGRSAAAALHRRQARRRCPRMPSATRPSMRATRARWRRRRPACISRRSCWRRWRRAASARHFVTLHVGAGTFLPVKAEDTARHRMHAEWGEISATTRPARSTPCAPRAGASSPSAPRRCGCWRRPPARMASISAVRRRDRSSSSRPATVSRPSIC